MPSEKAKAKWRKANRTYAREYHLKTKYGISITQYEAMRAYQEGLCAICKQPEPYNRSLCVDHCHTSGKVRGLLCTDCNRMIGLGKDKASTLRRAADYLEAAG